MEKLKAHIERLLSCKVKKHVGEKAVNNLKGLPVWQGTVHEFLIDGHPQTNTCYAWSTPVEGSEHRKSYAVLKIPQSIHRKTPCALQLCRMINSVSSSSRS